MAPGPDNSSLTTIAPRITRRECCTHRKSLSLATETIRKLKQELAKTESAKENVLKEKTNLQDKNRSLELASIELRAAIKQLKTKHHKIKTVREYLAGVGLTKVQIQKIMFPDTQYQKGFSTEDYINGLVISSISFKCYRYLVENTILALPNQKLFILLTEGHTTLPGLQTKALDLLKQRFLMDKDPDREAVMMFNEFGIKKKAEYSKIAGSFYGPVSKAQIVMVRGLTWKQIIYFDFERPMTKEFLFQLIQECEQINIRIRCICSDHANKELSRELGLDQTNNRFCNPTDSAREIFSFPGMQMCMKAIKALHEELETPLPTHTYQRVFKESGESMFAMLRAMGRDMFQPGPAEFIQRMHKMCCALLLPYQIEERKESRKKKAKQKTGSENTEDNDGGCDDALSIAVASTVLLQQPSDHNLQQQQQQLSETASFADSILFDAEVPVQGPLESHPSSVFLNAVQPAPPDRSMSKGGSKRLANPVQDGSKKPKLEGRAGEVKGFKYNKTGVGLLKKTVICLECLDQFDTVDQIKLHLHSGKPAEKIAIVYQDAEGRIYEKAGGFKGPRLLVCQYCNYHNNSVSNLKSHCSGTIHKDIKKIDLETCYRVYRKDGYTDGEERLVVKKPKIDFHELANSKDKSNCGMCSFATRSIPRLSEHMHTAHQLKPGFPCNQCSYETASKEDFIQHMKDAHKLVLGFKCGQCGYKTANKDLYHDHMQSHKPAAQSSQDLVNEDTNGSVISEAVALNDGIITIQDHGHNYIL